MKHRLSVDGGYLPGTLTYVYRRGQLVHTSICGQMDIERDKPMREDAIFRIFSMSKPITAVALYDAGRVEGLIGLDDAVHSHIPIPGRTWAFTPAAYAVAAARRAARLSDDAPFLQADEGRRPRDAHLRSYLRLYDAHGRRRGLSQSQGGRRARPWRTARDDRSAGRQFRSISSPGTATGTIRCRSTCSVTSSKSFRE